eukprot:CAMPEP_0175137042 /NCGR_PEP_ID=MMETSP0087-20121206/9601_1 /TAXON_ID=136419 /ORGANISM="Unknown Unknown, Strain D1" /LENGTH=1555 /DNA_ID=CAMNT_0016419845 /DNA_START=44 /DNA_END=4711 /DNA_ORIENTATION=-
MNGIVHNCTHGDGDELKAVPLTEDQMFAKIFKYIDKLFNIVQPKKLLYMAIDGTAPRAKMNQQRQRRFRSAQDAKEARAQAVARGEKVPETYFDSNCITPGTEFMQKLSANIQFFVRQKMKEDAGWQKIKVIFSGAEVPGEGEHKIMLYIRNMKMQPGYSPNLKHCLYGLDADLIMLALVSHEPHFALLREEVLFGNAAQKGLPRNALKNLDVFQFLHISLLREYLEFEFTSSELGFPFDLERVIDDWVVLGFLVGNDFLPHLPTMDIGEGGLDTMFRIYREELPKMGGYVTDRGEINHSRMEQIFVRLAAIEETVFATRLEEEHKFNKRRRRNEPRPEWVSDDEDEKEIKTEEDMKEAERKAEEEFQKNLEQMQAEEITFGGEVGKFKREYYREKYSEFFAEEKQGGKPAKDQIRKLCSTFYQGIVWCMKYYYQGCASWKWYFPYRYAPLASDMTDLASMDITMDLGAPFKPCEQLLGVLPPASAKFLPMPYRRLMLDETSSIKDYYPDHFEIDMNGKKSPWEGIALIPFIDETRLFGALKTVKDSDLTELERIRNTTGVEYIFAYDPKNTEVVKSTIPKLFKDIESCRSSKIVWQLPDIPEKGHFVPALCSDVQLPANGYPHIRSLKCEGALRPAGVNVFGRPSSKESLILTVDLPVKDTKKFATKFVGRRCFIDWPYLKEALVVSATDQTHKYLPRQEPTELKYEEKDRFLKDCKFYQVQQLDGKGVDIGEVELLLEVRMFEGMKRMPDGSIRKWFQQETTTVPAQLALSRHKHPDPRFADKPPPTVEEAFPKEADVVYIGPTHYGAVGTVAGYNEQKTDDEKAAPLKSLTVQLTSTGPESSFSRDIAKQPFRKWYPAHVIAKKLSINPLALSKICSSVFVKPANAGSGGWGAGRAKDVGLRFKYAKKEMIVPELARQVGAWDSKSSSQGGVNQNTVDGGAWQYSEKAVFLIHAYKTKYPALFNLLSTDPYARQYEEKQLLDGMVKLGKAKQDDYGSKSILDELMKFLDKVEDPSGALLSKMLLMPMSSSVLPIDGVKMIQEQAIELDEGATQSTVQLDNVPVHYLYKADPQVPWSPSEADVPSLGDRVLSLRSDHGVPFGLKGTVVGLHFKNKYVDVCFDRPFTAGDSLQGRCTDLHGKTLPTITLLNLSKPRVLQPKAMGPGVAMATVKATTLKTKKPAKKKKAAAPAAAAACASVTAQYKIAHKKNGSDSASSTNVRASTPSGPLKKDGTPDMQRPQSKSNKDQASSESSSGKSSRVKPAKASKAKTAKEKASKPAGATAVGDSDAVAADQEDLADYWKSLQKSSAEAKVEDPQQLRKQLKQILKISGNSQPSTEERSKQLKNILKIGKKEEKPSTPAASTGVKQQDADKPAKQLSISELASLTQADANALYASAPSASLSSGSSVTDAARKLSQMKAAVPNNSVAPNISTYAFQYDTKRAANQPPPQMQAPPQVYPHPGFQQLHPQFLPHPQFQPQFQQQPGAYPYQGHPPAQRSQQPQAGASVRVLPRKVEAGTSGSAVQSSKGGKKGKRNNSKAKPGNGGDRPGPD